MWPWSRINALKAQVSTLQAGNNNLAQANAELRGQVSLMDGDGNGRIGGSLPRKKPTTVTPPDISIDVDPSKG